MGSIVAERSIFGVGMGGIVELGFGGGNIAVRRMSHFPVKLDVPSRGGIERVWVGRLRVRTFQIFAESVF